MTNKSLQQRVPFMVGIPVVFGLGVITAMGLRGNAGAQNTKPPVQPTAQALELQTAFEQVAEAIRPSVVFIRAKQTARTAQDDGEGGGDFGIPGLPRGFRMPRQRGFASGSGVIVRGDGYILTNDHVVQGADKVTVRLQDGREFNGTVKRDFKSDLALIKIDATGLPSAQLADSAKAKVGQWAIAFGSPFGLNDTMTVGIVSSLHRNQQIGAGGNARYYASLIQTDASINPGNSGGPLVDLYGRVVGINVAIESPSGGSVGIGFAIPSNTAKYVMEQLITKGAVTRGYMGLAPKSLTYDEQKRYGVEKGVLVMQVGDKTPASKAGIQAEDVILRINGKLIETEADFRDQVARTVPGTSLSLLIKRDGAEKTISVQVGTAEETAKAPTQEKPGKAEARGKMGMVVGDASDPEVRKEARLKDTIKSGAVVVEVVPGSPASEAGIMPGDIVEKVDGKRTSTADELTSAIKALPAGKEVTLVIRRGEQQILVTIDLD